VLWQSRSKTARFCQRGSTLKAPRDRLLTILPPASANPGGRTLRSRQLRYKIATMAMIPRVSPSPSYVNTCTSAPKRSTPVPPSLTTVSVVSELAAR